MHAENTQTHAAVRRPVIASPGALAASGQTHESSGAAVLAGFLAYAAVMPAVLAGTLLILALGM